MYICIPLARTPCILVYIFMRLSVTVTFPANLLLLGLATLHIYREMLAKMSKLNKSRTKDFQFAEYPSAILPSAENSGNVMWFCVSTRTTDIFGKVKCEAPVCLKGLNRRRREQFGIGKNMDGWRRPKACTKIQVRT